MVQSTRQEMRRIDQTQSKHYKRLLAVIFFTMITVVFASLTFMNPVFMKSHVSSGSANVVVDRMVNQKFNHLAKTVGASSDDDENMLTPTQVQPLVNVMIDYQLGLHWFKTDETPLATQIKQILLTKIDDEASSGANAVKKALKARTHSAIYSIISSFQLANLTLLANLETLFVVINFVILMLCLLALIDLLRQMSHRATAKTLIHELMAAAMWAGGFLMGVFVILAAFPLLFNVEDWGVVSLGYFLEIGSAIFLEMVIIGAILFVISAIPWQLSSAK